MSNSKKYNDPEWRRASVEAGFLAEQIMEWDKALGAYFMRRAREKGVEIDRQWVAEMIAEARARGVPKEVLAVPLDRLEVAFDKDFEQCAILCQRAVDGEALDLDDALTALFLRRNNPPVRIDNASLHAGEPMHYYCEVCGWRSGVLDELHNTPVPHLCRACLYLANKGWIISREKRKSK